MSELQSDPVTLAGIRRQKQIHRYALAGDQIAGLQVLQLGLGDTTGAALLSQRAARLTAVDVNPERVAVAQRRIPQSGFHSVSFVTLPFEGDQFDAVIAFDLDWPDGIDSILHEIRRVLKPQGFAMLCLPSELSGKVEGEIRRVFRRRFSLGQRMVGASSIGPASAAALPNAADYRGYTVTSENEAVARVVRPGAPEDVIWIVGETALPQAESVDSLFLDSNADLLGVINAASATGIAAVPPVGDMTVLAALIEQLADGPIPGDPASLARALGQANVKLAVQDLKLAENDRLNAGLAAAEQNYRRLEDQLRESREETAATRLLATEQRARADHLDAQLETVTREAEARRQIIDEALAQAQTMAIDLERTRQEAARSGEFVTRLEADLAQIRQEADESRALTGRLSESLQDLQTRLDTQARETETIQSLAQTLDAELTRARDDADRQRSSADTAHRNLESLTAEIDAVRVLLQASEAALVEAQAVRQALDRQLELEREEAVAAEARRVSETEGLQARIVELETVREAIEGEVVRLQAELDTAHSSRAARAVTPPSGRQSADIGFAIGLRERIQHSAAAEVQAYRSGLAAAATIVATRKDIAETLSKASGAVTLMPATTPTLDPGPRRPMSRKAQLRAMLKGGRPEVPAAPLDAVAALFDPAYYLERNGVKPAQGETPFDHYVRVGRHKGLSTHPLIDTDWIRGAWPEVAETPFDLFTYITDARLHGRSPHPLFEADHYRRMNRDVADAGVNPLAHYLTHGWREGRAPNSMFNSDWYLATHTDVLAAGLNPLVHYARHGAGELRQPHPLFDHGFYLDRYPDVAASGMDAYAHFIAHGRGEGRLPCRQLMEMERLERFFDGAGLIDLVLGGEAPERRLRPITNDFWPPEPVGEYWLPQRLRDFIIDRWGEDRLSLNAWLFSLVEYFADAPEMFDASPERHKLVERIRLLASAPVAGAPRASIIIPVYNNLLYTLTCIISVLESAPSYSFEILVGDDGSTDETAEAITAIGGLVQHVRHSQNLGFLGNCNAVARRASGDHIVFLNNDTIVFPGWLDRLIETLDAHPEIGFVGSKLLNGDGTLQEAGGVFWRDGSAWNFGRNEDASAPEFNYLKDVDYVSGASIALPARLWKALDGFDPLFTPAYCEDSDLAFRVRQAGFRTVYHPHSVLVHHEGRSHGRDLSSGVKAYQVINQEKLFDRWRETLANENFNNAEHVFLARDRSRGKPHILIVDHYVPQWDRDAGSRTLYLYIRMFLDQGFAVTFWPDNLNEDRDYAEKLQALGVEVIYGAKYHNGFDTWFAQNGGYFEYAFLSRPHVSIKYISPIRAMGRAKIIYYGHDLHFRRLRAAYEIRRDKAVLDDADRWEAIEIAVCSQSDVVLYPGYEEIQEIRGRIPESVSALTFPITIFNPDEQADGLAAVRNGHDIDPFGLMFVGGFSHDPNTGGVLWFVREVMPLLRAADPRFHFSIAGSNAPDEISALDGAGVSVLGRISDEQLNALYARSALAIVPLLYGGGVKGKVIEAMARGVPVVMTSVGAQGITNATEMSYVEDNPAQMAQAILRATANRQDALDRARKALDFIDAHYSTRAVKSLLGAEIPELVSPMKAS